MKKIATKLLSLLEYENAPLLSAIGFYILGKINDTSIFYLFIVASVLTFFATKAICQAIRESKND